MDESDQILTIEELRSLRDRMSAEAAAPAAVAAVAPPAASATATAAATAATATAVDEHQPEVPGLSAIAAQQTRADPWQDMRDRAQGQRNWVKPLVAAGGLALVGGVVFVLVISGHRNTAPPPPAQVSATVVPTTAVPAPSAPEATAQVPLSTSGAPAPADLPPPAEPSVAAPVQPGGDVSGLGPATVPAPRITARSKPAPPAPRRPPAGANNDGPTRGAAPQESGLTSGEPSCVSGCPEPTLTRTPTSWNPRSP